MTFASMPHWLLTSPLLFLTGLVAGLVDSVAGGGGMITLPVLLSLGMPPQVALGTNKFQSSFGSFTASLYYLRKEVVSLRDAMPGVVLTFAGAALGTWSVQSISSATLGKIMPLMLAAILLYTLLRRELGSTDTRPRLRRRSFYVLAGLGLGFYDGFFGPGVGSFWAIAFVLGLGFNLTKATGYTKVMNFTSNIVAFALFTIGGNVWFGEAISMAAGQIVGARLGSGLVVKKGVPFIRPVFLLVVGMTIVKLFYDQFLR